MTHPQPGLTRRVLAASVDAHAVSTPLPAPQTTPAADIIGLSGWPRTGKDTVAAMLTDDGYTLASLGEHVAAVLADANPVVHLPLRAAPHRTAPVLFADALATLGYEGAKAHEAVRALMQNFGEAIKSRQPDFWIRQVLQHRKPNQRMVISGVRSVGEVHGIEQAGGVVWRITRPGTSPYNDHAVEMALDNYPFRTTLRNDSDLTALRALVRTTISGGAR